MRDQFDRIYNSISNGNKGDAVEYMLDLGFDNVPDLMDYLTHELNQPEATEKLLKHYFYLLGRK